MHLFVIIFLTFIRYICSEDIDTEMENMINDRSDRDFADHIDKITTGKLNSQSRVPKFLTFNNDASNIRVEAVFAIPILAIPIGGKSVTSQSTHATLPKVDINLKSIISMAGIFFLLFFVIPKLVQLYLPQKLSPVPLQTPYNQQLNTITERIDEALNKFNVDVDSCAQKAICWTINKSSNSDEGKKESNGLDKLIDAVSSIPYLNYFIEDTWLGAAIKTISVFKNQEQGTCQKFNKKCSITQRGLSNAAMKLAKYLYLPHQKG